MAQTQSVSNVDYYLSSYGVDRVCFNKNSSPPLAPLDRGILYEMTDGILYFNGAAIAAGGVVPDERMVVNTGATASVPGAGYMVKLWQENNDASEGDVINGTASLRDDTSTAASATTITLDAGASAVNNFYQDMWIQITSGAGVDQVRQILSYIGATKVATVSAWTVTPDNVSDFSIFNQNYVGMIYDPVLVAWRWIGITHLEDDPPASTSDDSTLSADFGRFNRVQLRASSNQIVLVPGSHTIALTASNPAADRIYTIPDALADANFVLSEGAETINGIKTFSAAPVLTSGGAGLKFQQAGVGNKISLQAVSPVADRLYTLPDVSADTSFVMAAGAQTIAGAKTLSSAPVLTAASNQLVVQPSGSGNSFTLTAANPASNRIYTIPDVSSDTSFVMAAGNQTIAGTKTLSGQLKLTGASNQLVIQANGSGNGYTITASNPAASRTYTIPDAGGTANFIMSDAGSVQFINTGVLDVVAGLISDSTLTLNKATNQLVINPGNGVNSFTINAAAPASSLTYTLPYAAVNANIMVTSIKGATPSPTQGTSNTTAVTATATTGLITMFGTIGSGASAAFTFNNVNILSNSNVVAWSNMTSATLGKPVGVVVTAIASGSCTITVTNSDGANATNAAAVVYYLII